jgi:hypothetical protein
MQNFRNFWGSLFRERATALTPAKLLFKRRRNIQIRNTCDKSRKESCTAQTQRKRKRERAGLGVVGKLRSKNNNRDAREEEAEAAGEKQQY